MPNPFSKEKNLSEIEEESEKGRAEDELLGTRLSIARKRVAIAELKKRGLTAKHFGDTSIGQTWTKIFNWIKEH